MFELMLPTHVLLIHLQHYTVGGTVLYCTARLDDSAQSVIKNHL